MIFKYNAALPIKPQIALNPLKSHRRDLASALKDVKAHLKPGFVINEAGWSPLWQFWWRVPNFFIRGDQRRIFGRQSIWYDTHCMLFLDDDHTLSVGVPRAKWLKPEDYCLSRISIWRFTKHKPLNKGEKQILIDYAEKQLIGRLYNVRLLLVILINNILGYSNVLHLKRSDLAKYRKVCSVGVRMLFEKLRQVLKQNRQPCFEKLFRNVNPLAPWPGGVFPQSRISDQYGVDVEATTPAHFANSQYFDNEFELIAVFDQGWPVYIK
jgi:hypothetical protein